MKYWWKRFFKAILFLIFVPQVIFFSFVAITSFIYKWVDPPISSLMILRAFQGTKIQPTITLRQNEIPAIATEYIVFLEDHDYWHHSGIVLGAIREAYETNKRVKRIMYGGSTISQQIARTLFLLPNKNYARKYLEAGTAILMDKILGKKRLLVIYFNNIEWGPGIFGLGTAAEYYYDKTPRHLSEDQIARLESVIVNPIVFSPKRLPFRSPVYARYRALMLR